MNRRFQIKYAREAKTRGLCMILILFKIVYIPLYLRLDSVDCDNPNFFRFMVIAVIFLAITWDFFLCFSLRDLKDYY